MIEFDEMPKSAQKAYKVNNVVRKITMKLSWITMPLLFITCCIISIKEKAFPQEFLLDLEVGLFIGCALHGLIHSGFFIKIALRKIREWVLPLGILFGLFALIPILFVVIGVPYFCAVFGGLVFEIIDTIRYLKKMPLIYNWELKHFLN